MHDDLPMRTTLDLDEDILQATKEMALAKGTTAGKVLSDLARKALAPARAPRLRNGIPLLPCRPASARRPTMRQVNELRDDA
jgi:hypothetical protein